MKIKRLLAGVIASAMAISAMAITASAVEITQYDVLGVYVTTDTDIKTLDKDGLAEKGVTITIDEVKLDGEVQSETDALVYADDKKDELKAELFNIYNAEAPNALKAFPTYRIDVTFTIKGATGTAYLGGGLNNWAINFWGEDGDTDEDVDTVDVKVDGDGTYTVSVVLDEEPADEADDADAADHADEADEDEKPATNPTTGMPIAGAGLVVLATASLAAATIIKKK